MDLPRGSQETVLVQLSEGFCANQLILLGLLHIFVRVRVKCLLLFLEVRNPWEHLVGLHVRQHSCPPIISSKVFYKSPGVQSMLVGNLCKFILQIILTNNAQRESELRLSEIEGVRLSDTVGGMLMSSLLN